MKALTNTSLRWVNMEGVLSNRIALPSQQEMMEDVKAFYSSLEASGTPQHYTHNIYAYKSGYEDWLAVQCGCPVFEEWRKQMFVAATQNLIKRPETCWDEWDDHHLLLQPHEDFRKYTFNGIGVMDK